MKKILYILGGVVILGAILLFVQPNLSDAPTTDNSPTDDKDISYLPDLTLPLSNNPKDVSWYLFQKYLAFNKARDVEGVRSVVYKISAVCEDPKTTIDCESRMNAAYQYGIALKKQNFVNIWEDDKQLILATNFWDEENDISIGRFRSIIFFIKDEKGDLKLLSFSPGKGVATQKGDASIEELKERAVRYTEDNDNDGKADYTEECLDAKDKTTCIQTDPKSRDSDGNGFWDGVDALL